MRIRSLHPSTWAAWGVYFLLLVFGMLEQFGSITNDTKTPLIEEPGSFLVTAATLWNSQMNFGELQNQAYGYLFPQGPFFWLLDLCGSPAWVTERLWSWLVLVVAAEGARHVARAIGLAGWPAWMAAMAYGLSPRLVGQVTTRSAEVLPIAVLPWVLLPIILVLTGRLAQRRGALLSVGAFLFSGAVNGTAMVAGLPLVVIVMLFGIRAKRATWSLVGWWSGLMVVANAWWVSSLLILNAYTPPFFDYVEDANTTTATTDYEPALRGASNWVGYIYTGEQATWPAGFALAYQPVLVLTTGLVATLGVIGLARFTSWWRRPLVVSLLLGMFCMTVGTASAWQSPLSPLVRDALDGLFALLRNVSKVDALIRLPLALGVGALTAELLSVKKQRVVTGGNSRQGARGLRGSGHWQTAALLLVGGLVLATAQPVLALNTRTPGWAEPASHWQQAADYLAEQPEGGRAWVVPGTGFGVQTWGWTQDEPMQAVATTPWVSRSQVPLVPPQTIRMVSRLEELLQSGKGSPMLELMLTRLGIDHVVVRHDLDPGLSEASSATSVSMALARSPGIERVAAFGAGLYGPAIEVYAVADSDYSDLRVVDEHNVVTVAGGSVDALDAVGAGLVGPEELAVVQGDQGWDRPADVVGDAYRLREHDFGRVLDADGPVKSPEEPARSSRKVRDYPGNDGADLVVADYDTISYVDASSSQGWVDVIGRTQPENAPFAAVDGSEETEWRSGYYTDPSEQWLEVRYPHDQEFGRVDVSTPVFDLDAVPVTRLRVTAGGRSRMVDVDPATGRARADLGGAVGDRLRVSVAGLGRDVDQGYVAIREVRAAGLPATRTLVVPETTARRQVDFVFTSDAETQACMPTLLAPDCDPYRARRSEESLGIDRTFTVPEDGTWSLRGTGIARSTPSILELLAAWHLPATLTASSTYWSDPAVAVRFAHDQATQTSWLADPREDEPTVTVSWRKRRTVDRLSISPPAAPGIAPTQAVVTTPRGEERTVDLSGYGAFEPLRTRRLTITFRNPTRGVAPIGLGELHLAPAVISAPFRGADPTGAVCGLGPVVEVDGVEHRTKVSGFVGDLISSGPMKIELCGDDIELSAGIHRMRVLSTGQFQPLAVALSSGRERTSRVADRELRLDGGPITDQRGRVSDGGAAILATSRNFNAGWSATVDGVDLEPQMVGGWAQGWRVPAGVEGELRIVYTPQRPYVIALVGGLGLAALVLGAALLRSPLRRRLPTGVPAGPVHRWRPAPSRWRCALVALVSWASAGVLWGVPGLLAVGLASVLLARGRRSWLLPLAGAVLVSGACIASWELLEGPVMSRSVANPVYGVGFLLAMAAAWTASHGAVRE